jgi:HEPN domain-containing protein
VGQLPGGERVIFRAVSTKAILRRAGIDPPKWHDVSSIIHEHIGEFPVVLQPSLRISCDIARSLAKEREQAFCGEEDSIPTEQYTRAQADKAISEAQFVVALCRTLVSPAA